MISVQDTTDTDDNELRIENTEVDSKYGNELYIRNELDCAEIEEYVLNI